MSTLRGDTMPPARLAPSSWMRLCHALRRPLEVALRSGRWAPLMATRRSPPRPPDQGVWHTAAGVIAHDLRAPAAAIVALSDLQRLKVLPGDVFVEQVARQARQALALTDELVALLREPVHAYQLAPVDLVELLRNGIEARWCADGNAAGNAAGDADVSPRLTAHPREAWVMGDARMLGAVLDVMLGRVCMRCGNEGPGKGRGTGRAEGGGQSGHKGDVELRLTCAHAVHHLVIRARCADDTAATALSAAAPAGLLVRRVLHRHGGALAGCGQRQADGIIEWHLALPAWAGRAANKKAPEGAFLRSVA